MFVLVSQDGKFHREITGAMWQVHKFNNGTASIYVNWSGEDFENFGTFKNEATAIEATRQLLEAIANGQNVFKIPKESS